MFSPYKISACWSAAALNLTHCSWLECDMYFPYYDMWSKWIPLFAKHMANLIFNHKADEAPMLSSSGTNFQKGVF